MFQKILAHWEGKLAEIQENPWIKRLEVGDMDICHYKGYLHQQYHLAGPNPQIQAYATMFFKENNRDILRMFYRHAISEIGHDLLALNDFEALGGDVRKVLNSKPLPETVAFLATPIYLIQFQNPLCYLGYLFHLEFFPTRRGLHYIEMFKKKGIPENALTFIEEHATIDVGHNKMMERYVAELPKEKDLDDILFAIDVTVKNHIHSVVASFIFGEKNYS